MAVLGNKCLASVDALIVVNVKSLRVGVQNETAARGGVAAVEPPDEADIPCMQNGEPTSVEASWMPESDQRGGVRGLIPPAPPSPVLSPRSFNPLRAWARCSHEAWRMSTPISRGIILKMGPRWPQQPSSMGPVS